MSRKFDELEIARDNKPTKTYTFEADCEYQGAMFHKFQRRTKLKDGNKWQTFTVSPADWAEFAEWMEYILSAMKTEPGSAEDAPF